MLLCPCVSPSASADELRYFSRDSYLKNDPTVDGKIQTKINKGAWINVFSCSVDGWCYGRVYGYDEGWVVARDLQSEKPETDRPKDSFDYGGAWGEGHNGERAHHLQDSRKDYFLGNVSFATGSGTLSTADFKLLKRNDFNNFLIGWGQHFSVSNNKRWSREFTLSISTLSNRVSHENKSSVLTSLDLLLGAGLLRMEPYSPDYGWGFRGRVYLKTFRKAVPDYGTAPPWYLFQLGMVVSHGLGNLKNPKRLEWDVMTLVNHRQAMLGLGLNVIF